jgi:phage-related protein
MAGASELVVRITGKDTGLKATLVDAGHDVDRFGDRFDGLGHKMASFGKVAALGLGAAAVGVGAFLKSSAEAAEEARKVMAQTEAVIKSTGGAAKVSAKDIGTLADELAGFTGIDDEVIASGANMLLTFTNIRNEIGKGNNIFDQATKAALNMSVAMGTDMKSSALLVGKALNDPIAGMTALTRSGVQFTQQQKDQVKAMVAAGDVLGAQKVILKELETQFGGSAEAAASPLARLKVVVGNLQEELGARLLPVIATVATWLADRLPAALDRAGSFIGPIIEKIGMFVAAFRSAFSEGVTSDGAVGVFERIGVAVQTVIAFVQENWPKIQQYVSEGLETTGAVIAGFVDIVTTLWNNVGEQIVSYTQNAFESAMQIISGAMEMIRGVVATVTALIHGDWSGAWDGIKTVLAGALDAIIGIASQWDNMMRALMSVAMEVLGSIVSAGFNGIVDFVSSIPGRIVSALGDLGNLLYNAGTALMRGLLRGIVDAAEGVYNYVKGIAGKIASLKGPIEKDRKLLIPQGQAIMDSLVTGLRAHEARLVSYLGQVTGMVSGVGGSAMTATAPMGLPSRDGGFSSSSAPAAGGNTININITVSGQMEPQHLAREIAWAMG